jgi:transcriptional regulator with XRE-family HTH domain
MTRELKQIGLFLRSIRESGGHGSIASLAKQLGIDKNTLQSYETGRTLPDADFLAVFADRTGADFNELLRLRLLSGKTPEARRLGELWTPPPDTEKIQDVNQASEKLADLLDELVENAEIQWEGEDSFAFLDTQVRENYVNDIKRLLIYHEFPRKDEGRDIPYEKRGAQCDIKRMAMIATKLEIAFLTSDAAALAFHRFINDNWHLLRKIAEVMKVASDPDEIPIDGLLKTITRKWVRYAGTEAAAVTYIYNKLLNTPEEHLAEALTNEISFFQGFRSLELADEYVPTE